MIKFNVIVSLMGVCIMGKTSVDVVVLEEIEVPNEIYSWMKKNHMFNGETIPKFFYSVARLGFKVHSENLDAQLPCWPTAEYLEKEFGRQESDPKVIVATENDGKSRLLALLSKDKYDINVRSVLIGEDSCSTK